MVTPNTTPYKPSPLSFGSPRTSPFRRQSTVISPNAVRANAPGSPASKPATPSQSPSKPNQLHVAEDDDIFAGDAGLPVTTRFREFSPSPTRGATAHTARMSPKTRESQTVNNELFSRLPPAQVREMREAFQVLDRDNDGQVNKGDIKNILNNLGQDSSPSATDAYFPPGSSQTINLPTYLNTIASLVVPLSDPQELLNAFAAFDEDDSGQIDFAELRDALLHTAPEGDERRLTDREIDEVVFGFTGRRAFGSKGARQAGLSTPRNRGEVFRYRDFVSNIAGSGQATKNSLVNV
ncbi:hypothetical protein LOZ53_006036 [Ophidiomyces ophidiicola]|uniref:Uncharacterized protein n=1 Tax=Ophidiomyces ophidiicola TaxID=1387563 RepID=A0ACB8UNS1_9EURO|nr:hypothetical protein LOZ61_000753 [Ophidiomyces ophidiicola]KAI1917012.1 hypothetical protein LOZ64_003163 [Ophidiomyces ophidiicola]KAI1926727.1 hypothetical protein LOZ60_003430 [Ophidiomyces ophidiicola]KAI1948708.1 hypothetical protein LOZ59_006302 [Ophidiomyces ophidiicola]KAI1969284.1 hypothetical protein LOZ56_004574 [Ophidiomyces ophidiicola]